MTEDSIETSTNVPPSLESKIKKATDSINSLNKNIIESLAGTMDKDAHSSVGTYISDFEARISNGSFPFSALNSSLLQPNEQEWMKKKNETSLQADQKFSDVMKDLQEFEDHLRESIRNFTTTRQYAYRNMLRPMLQQVQQLRSNLTHLRNHLVGYHAVTELQQHVNTLTAEIGDAITSGSGGPVHAMAQTQAESGKPASHVTDVVP